MATSPFPHGKGLGMGGVPSSRSSEPVSRPTARRSPHKFPSSIDGGAVGGARWVARRMRCLQCVQVGAATQRAAKPTAPFTRCGDPATDVTPSEPKVSDWRGGRAAAGHLCDSAVGLQAARHRGVAGGRGDDLARAQRTGAERNEVKCSAVREQRASSSSGPVGRVPATDIRARDPRPREGPPSGYCRRSRPSRVLREGCERRPDLARRVRLASPSR